MSMWRKTLEYLGLEEEPDEYVDIGHRSDEVGPRSSVIHDATGPVPVVRASVDGGEPDPDLTQPVAVVDAAGARERAAGPAPAPRSGSRGGRRTQRGSNRAHDNVRQLRAVKDEEPAGMAGVGRRVAIVAVADYEAGAREVGQRFRAKNPVVFDLTDAPVEDRRRVLDFVAGVTFALHGEMKKVAPRAFLVVPEGSEVDQDEWRRLAGLGYRA